MHSIDLAFARWKADPSTVDDLLDRLRPIVRGWAGNDLSEANKDFTEDVTQIAMTMIWQKLPIITGNVMSFAKVVTRNACLGFAANLGYKGRTFTQPSEDSFEPAPEPRHREFSLPDLTPTEQAICDHVAMGFTYREIAQQLDLKHHKIKDIFASVRRKCGINVPPPNRDWNKTRAKLANKTTYTRGIQ
jgi:DNA-binding CsgD family transcriptional regulator